MFDNISNNKNKIDINIHTYLHIYLYLCIGIFPLHPRQILQIKCRSRTIRVI